MTKTDLIKAVAVKTGMTKKDAEGATLAVIDSIVEALAAGEKVQIVGFGTFEVKERGERVLNNPQKKDEKIVVPASKYPTFKAGKTLKDMVAR